MNTQHTPGPWKFAFGKIPDEIPATFVEANEARESFESKTIGICNQDGEILGNVIAYTTPQFLQDFKQWEANAHLIVTAPKLLKALQSVLSDLKDWENYNNLQAEKFDLPEAAMQIAISDEISKRRKMAEAAINEALGK